MFAYAPGTSASCDAYLPGEEPRQFQTENPAYQFLSMSPIVIEMTKCIPSNFHPF